MSFALRRPTPKLSKPDKRLLVDVPLRFVHQRVAGRGGRELNRELPLIPFIDFLITLVVFLLMSFSATGEIRAQSATLRLPSALNVLALTEAPVLAIDRQVLTLEGRRVIDTPSLASRRGSERVGPLADALDAERRRWEMVHPGRPNPGVVIFSVDRSVESGVVKKAIFTAATAGYTRISFAVNRWGS